MPGFDYILLDADGTLFDFQKAQRQALKKTLTGWSIPFSEEILKYYNQINKECWASFERGEVKKEDMLKNRFALLFRKLRVSEDPEVFNRRYLNELGKGAYLLDGAYELCEELYNRGMKLYIATNGVKSTQEKRLSASSIAGFISDMFISEELGFQKPQPQYFDKIFNMLRVRDRERVIILGDSLDSDMQGGRNAGIKTCWFTADTNAKSELCDYIIFRHSEFLDIIFNSQSKGDMA